MSTCLIVVAVKSEKGEFLCMLPFLGMSSKHSDLL